MGEGKRKMREGDWRGRGCEVARWGEKNSLQGWRKDEGNGK